MLPDGAALAPWRTPAVTLRLLVAPLGQRSSVPANGPAAAFEAHVTVGEDRLVALVRRDGVGLVELTTAPVEALGDELERVLQGLGGAPGDGTEVRVSRAAFAALCEGGGGPGADVLARATRVLETTLVTPDGAVTGGLWYDADGWWRVDVLGADVVLHPAAPRARDWAPLLDQVLT